MAKTRMRTTTQIAIIRIYVDMKEWAVPSSSSFGLTIVSSASAVVVVVSVAVDSSDGTIVSSVSAVVVVVVVVLVAGVVVVVLVAGVVVVVVVVVVVAQDFENIIIEKCRTKFTGCRRCSRRRSSSSSSSRRRSCSQKNVWFSFVVFGVFWKLVTFLAWYKVAFSQFYKTSNHVVFLQDQTVKLSKTPCRAEK